MNRIAQLERLAHVMADALNESLTAWEGEEESVKEEHQETIETQLAALAQYDLLFPKE